MINFSRGTVWWIELPLKLHSHVQGGARPCVIVSNPLDRSGVVTVCPLSTKIDSIKTHPRVFVKKEGQVLIEQITTVDISSIGNYVGKVDDLEMSVVDEALKAHLLGESVKSETVTHVEEKPKYGMKLFNIERKLDKIIAMLDYIMWKENRSNYEKDLRNI